jgi:hypothetical protein
LRDGSLSLRAKGNLINMFVLEQIAKCYARCASNFVEPTAPAPTL